MKLDKVLCCMFLFSFLALTLHKTQMYFLTLWNARFFVVLFRVFGIRGLHCFRI